MKSNVLMNRVSLNNSNDNISISQIKTRLINNPLDIIYHLLLIDFYTLFWFTGVFLITLRLRRVPQILHTLIDKFKAYLLLQAGQYRPHSKR